MPCVMQRRSMSPFTESAISPADVQAGLTPIFVQQPHCHHLELLVPDPGQHVAVPRDLRREPCAILSSSRPM